VDEKRFERKKIRERKLRTGEKSKDGTRKKSKREHREGGEVNVKFLEAERENKKGEENGKGGGDWNRVKNIIEGRSREQKESGEENNNRENAKRARDKEKESGGGERERERKQKGRGKSELGKKQKRNREFEEKEISKRGE
jgi:hypothetical protein